MRYRMLGGALAALAFLTLAPAALAQSWTSYGLLDASRSTQHFPCLSTTLNGVAVCYAGHVLMGTSAGSPTAVNMTIPGALDVNVVKGSGSSQPFAPDSYAPATLAPTTTSTSVAAPGTGSTIRVTNNGSVPVYVAVGASTVTATTSSTPMYPGIARYFYYSPGSAYVAGITSSGTGSLLVASGTGQGSDGIDTDMTPAAPVKGTIAAGSTASDPPVAQGCRAATTAPTAVTDGQVVNAMCGTSGKRVVEWSPSALQVKGSASATTTAAATLLAAPGAGLKLYVTQLQCSNTSATTVTATLNDSASSVFIVPAGSGNNPPPFLIPLDVAANTALTFTLSAGASTVSCNVQGFKGS